MDGCHGAMRGNKRAWEWFSLGRDAHPELILVRVESVGQALFKLPRVALADSRCCSGGVEDRVPVHDGVARREAAGGRYLEVVAL